jgi:hypothetical protein
MGINTKQPHFILIWRVLRLAVQRQGHDWSSLDRWIDCQKCNSQKLVHGVDELGWVSIRCVVHSFFIPATSARCQKTVRSTDSHAWGMIISPLKLHIYIHILL